MISLCYFNLCVRYDITHHAVVIISQRLCRVQWPTRPIGQWLGVSKVTYFQILVHNQKSR